MCSAIDPGFSHYQSGTISLIGSQNINTSFKTSESATLLFLNVTLLCNRSVRKLQFKSIRRLR